ncbi:MAG: M24 family metallopeptidase [Bdellovibrionota bacterium]
MTDEIDESVGTDFNRDLLRQASVKTLEVIERVASSLRPGSTEAETRKLVQVIQASLGAPKSWHPPQIRFGENTLMPFGEPGQENLTLKENDIFFLDIGAIFDGHEGDVARPFTVGNDTEMQKCCVEAKEIWIEVRNHWFETKVSGGELYEFAKKATEKRGWILSLHEANGHRIADFPHIARSRGNIQEFPGNPLPDRWILEIQIRHPSRKFGAFYEDLLN